jgi:hypothetical protein
MSQFGAITARPTARTVPAARRARALQLVLRRAPFYALAFLLVAVFAFPYYWMAMTAF